MSRVSSTQRRRMRRRRTGATAGRQKPSFISLSAGIYGRNFFWKKKDASAGVGLESTMAESNKPQTA